MLVRKSLARLFSSMGHEVLLAESLAGADTEAEKGVDVIYLDIDLPDGDGLKAIDSLAAARGRPEVIVITGLGRHYGARESLRGHACWDYISKPASPQAVEQTLRSALEYRRQSKASLTEVACLNRCGLVGEDPAFLRVLQTVGNAARTDASVLVSGETGVGKELAAEAIHANSRRKDALFVPVDCSNMTESLVESMLYGHARGAFTGAHADREGLVAEAHGGTLFLDEVGELSLSLQKSFLRVLQERRYRPVGAKKERSSDFRLVAATNRDLDEMARKGAFRSDLLFRIRTVEIAVPPLRDRHEDKRRLAVYFIRRFCNRYGLEPKQVSQEMWRVVLGYGWPGNVREMCNAMEAAVINAGRAPMIYPKNLPGSVRLSFFQEQENRARPEGKAKSLFSPDLPDDPGEILSYNAYKARADREYFSRLLEAVDYNIGEVSRISGLSVPSVYRRLAIAEIPTRKNHASR
ncbi:MAG: sigma-54 dependent transcriptional regulator [Desulfosarcinaceae bacterium]